MRRGGVAAVSPVGVLGDPTTATAAEGKRILAEMVDGCVRRVGPVVARARRDADMSQPRLPDGFAVQVDRRVRVLGDGSALLGGSPTRLLRLAPAAQDMLCDGRLKVRDDVSAQLARTLLDATVAHPRPAGGPSHRDVTVVIPVRDNLSGVRRLVSSLRGLRVIVVDDGSFAPIEPDDFVGAHCDVEVLRHPRSRGPAAARNTGLAACTTDFVAFLDSDVVPRRGLAGGAARAFLRSHRRPGRTAHRRSVAQMRTWWRVTRRCTRRSTSAQREAPVLPHSTVSYVPSAAIICRCVGPPRRRRVRRDPAIRRGRRPVLAAYRSRRPAALRAHRAGRPRPPHRTARLARAQGVLWRFGGPAVGPPPGQDGAGGDLRLGLDGLDPDGIRDQPVPAGVRRRRGR